MPLRRSSSHTIGSIGPWVGAFWPHGTNVLQVEAV